MDDKVHWTDDDYFKSTQGNVKLLTGEVDTGYFPATAFCWMSIACPIVSILTLPADAVVDVVALPHDYYAAQRQ
ncbi:YceK/YidQ family lipoprotein [Pseudomonas sp. NY15181]|uniref:YceK/YidQ family lipoprotein n=1 Tax=Pseudomonas sp. NY15181 TaxID=3400349 RepID=UPI003A86AF6D